MTGCSFKMTAHGLSCVNASARARTLREQERSRGKCVSESLQRQEDTHPDACGCMAREGAFRRQESGGKSKTIQEEAFQPCHDDRGEQSRGRRHHPRSGPLFGKSRVSVPGLLRSAPASFSAQISRTRTWRTGAGCVSGEMIRFLDSFPNLF